MTQLRVFYAPGTCSRAVLIALEEANATYKAQLLIYMQGEHKSDDYLALNPNGKTPLLLVDNQAIHETSAILLYLAHAFPEAKLLPLGKSNVNNAKVIADLIWCSSELHPNVFRIRIPQYFCDHPEGCLRQKEMAMESMHTKFSIIEERLSKAPWFLGENWSVIDAYLFWVWFRLNRTGFNFKPYPAFADHYKRIQKRPSVIKAMKIEQNAGIILHEKGLMVNFETFQPGIKPEDFTAQIVKKP